ncbi:unnamed protein product [Symbiodinium sp. CCMP2592]|nr:unnamed protein product [Symbiodinium sp. CCMP2592]
MSYSQALGSLRFFMCRRHLAGSSPDLLTREEASAFTMHSLKVCLLSAGAQIQAADKIRQQQGHHKNPSVQLYGRDDTLQALALQTEIAQACASSWRPTRPIARGGQHPTVEPPFEVSPSPPPMSFPLAALGQGLDRFVYAREAELEAALNNTQPASASGPVELASSAAPNHPGKPKPRQASLQLYQPMTLRPCWSKASQLLGPNHPTQTTLNTRRQLKTFASFKTGHGVQSMPSLGERIRQPAERHVLQPLFRQLAPIGLPTPAGCTALAAKKCRADQCMPLELPFKHAVPASAAVLGLHLPDSPPCFSRRMAIFEQSELAAFLQAQGGLSESDLSDMGGAPAFAIHPVLISSPDAVSLTILLDGASAAETAQPGSAEPTPPIQGPLAPPEPPQRSALQQPIQPTPAPLVCGKHKMPTSAPSTSYWKILNIHPTSFFRPSGPELSSEYWQTLGRWPRMWKKPAPSCRPSAQPASALFFRPPNHFFFQSEPFCEAVHDGGLFLCPEPDSDRVILATAPLPTWPCADPGLAALEAAGMFAAMPLSTRAAQPLALTSALQTHGDLVKNRAPICDGAGNASSADWSHPQPSPSAMQDIMQAWLKWASQRDIPKRIFAHLSQSKPEHPLPEEDQFQLIRIACEVMDWDYDSMIQAADGQPFRLNLMQAFADLLDDPDKNLPALLRPAPDTVRNLLADEEAAGWIKPVPVGLEEAKRIWPKGIAVGKLSLVKAENRDPRLVLDSTVCQVNPMCRIPEAVAMPTVNDVRATFMPSDPRGVNLPLKARIIEVGSRPVHCKADLPPQPKSSRVTWVRISDPSCPEIKLTNTAQDSLRWLLPRIEAIPTTSLSLPPLVLCLGRADALAEGDRVGIGGWITTKQSMAWFAEAWSMEEIRNTWPFLTKDAQRYIACFETLAQLALAMTARERHAFSQFSVCWPSQSDNTPSEAGINKLFTTSWPLSQFLQLIASWSSCHGVDLQVSHVAGAHNQGADDLSRGHLQAFSHRPQERVRISLHRLASAASQAHWSGAPDSACPLLPRSD